MKSNKHILGGLGLARKLALYCFALLMVLAGCGGDQEQGTGGRAGSGGAPAGAGGQGGGGGDACLAAPVTADPPPVGHVVRIAEGGNNGCAIFEGGSMRCWGDNTYGQLGFGDLWSGGFAHLTGRIPPVERVAIGAGHMCALTVDHCVWCWGDDSYGQLGIGNKGGGTWPVLLDGMVGVVEVATDGGLASFALHGDGQVDWWGAPDLQNDVHVPATLFQGTSFVSIAFGYRFGCGLRSDGRVECWGDNEFGQLGTGDQIDRAVPTVVAGLTDVVQIALGAWISCALRSDMSLWCWGSNAGGQLGDGTTTDQWTPQKVALTDVVHVALASHTCAVVASGRVFCWGNNSFQQVGNGAKGAMILSPWEIVGVEGARGIAAGGMSTCVLLDDHDVRCWGNNTQWDLGDGTGMNSSTPVKVLWEAP